MNIKNLHQFKNMNFSWISKIQPVLNKINGEWRFVGGCIRDSLLGILVSDIDITTTLSAQEVENMMQDFTLNVIGKKFGTIGVFFKGFSIEITTTRRDVKTFGRSAEVNFSGVDFKEDSERRDFTINSIMMDKEYNIYDYHNGINDLKQGVVRFVGDGHLRIQEDYLRIIRYIRFFVRFNENGHFDMKLVKQYVHNIRILSKERIIKEMESMCSKKNTSYAFKLLNESEISQIFWGNLLNTNIDDTLNSNEKFAYGLWHFYDLKKNMPLNKNVKYLIDLRKPSSINDIYIHCAFLWNKYKNTQAVTDFVKIHKYIYQEDVDVCLEWNDKYLNLFEGPQRGKVEILSKYYCLKNHSYDSETLKQNIEMFDDIKKHYK